MPAPFSEYNASTTRYRYGFNSQEKSDEIVGAGNHTTAEFWEYDTRLGRRWNLDPVVKLYESPYASFANNPIWFLDPEGSDTLDINRNDKGKWVVSKTQVIKGDDVFRIKSGDEVKTFKFSEGEYGKRFNVLNLENNDKYTLGIYHISGKDEDGATGFTVTPGGGPSTKTNSGKRLRDDVYKFGAPASHGLKWVQPGIESGMKSGYVGGRGVRIHPAPSKTEQTGASQWTEGCYVVCTDYSLLNGGIYYKSKLSIQTSKLINTMLGASTHYNSIGTKSRPGSDFNNGIKFTLIQKSAF